MRNFQFCRFCRKSGIKVEWSFFSQNRRHSCALCGIKIPLFSETARSVIVADRVFLCQIEDGLPLPLCLFRKLSCAAPTMGDVGHHIIGLAQHPLVAPGYGESWRHSFQTFRKNGVGEIPDRLVPWPWQSFQHHGVRDVGVDFCQFPPHRPGHGVKGPLASHIESIHTVPHN